MATKKFDFSGFTSDELANLQEELKQARNKAIEKEKEENAKAALSSPEITKAVKKLDDLVAKTGDLIKATDGVTLKIPCVLNLKLETDGESLKHFKTNVASGYVPSTPCEFYVNVVSVDLADAQLTKKQASTFRHGVKEFVEGACSEIHPLFTEIGKIQAEFKKLNKVGFDLIATMREKGIKSLK